MAPNKLKIFLMIAAVSLFFVSQAAAEAYTIDKENSTIFFKVDHTVGFNSGFMENFSGSIGFDKKAFKLTKINVTVEMDSVNTFNEDRDELMKSEKFYDVKKYPESKLVSTKIEEKTVAVKLTFHGKTKTVNFDYAIVGMGQTEAGKEKLKLQIAGVVDRKEFGIDYNVTTEAGESLLGEKINILMDIVAVEQ